MAAAERHRRHLSSSRTAVPRCLQEVHNQIEHRHGSECVKAVHACDSANHDRTSGAAEGLLACAPSTPDAMMRLRGATSRGLHNRCQ